jgi:putative ABC transport system permease protein
MSFFPKLRTLMNYLFHRGRIEHEMDEEFRSHLAMRVADLERQGISSREAERQARIEFGGYENYKEECRETLGTRLLQELAADIRYGLRQFRRNPGFTAVAVLTLALGIGASTVIFSLFNAVFLRPLPVRQPGQLVRLVYHVPKVGTRSAFPLDYMRALSERATSFESVLGQLGGYHFAMSDPGPTEEIALKAVTPGFFSALGVQALFGRVITAGDATNEPGPPPAVLSYNFWERRFAGNPSVVNGRTIIVNEEHFTVVGVMPRRFGGLSLDSAPDLWIPMRAFPPLFSDRGGVRTNLEMMQFELAARVKPGVKPKTAQAECQAIWTPVMKDYYEHTLKLSPKEVSEDLRDRVWLEPLGHGVSVVRSQFGNVFKLLMASAGLLFLIVCTNISGLLLARNAARKQEISIRLAVGATRRRLAQQMITEGFLLAILGAASGLLMAWAATPFAAGQLPTVHDLMGWPVPVSLDPHVSVAVLLFMVLLTVLATLFFGITPAVVNLRTKLDTALRGFRASTRLGGRRVLIVIQIGLCAMLLTTAGLLVRTFQNLAQTDPGFRTNRVVTFTVNLTGRQVRPDLLKRLIARVDEMPGVVAAGAARVGVMRGHGMVMGLAPAGQQITRADDLNTNLNDVSPGYFNAMGMRILAGRNFAPGDEPKGKHSGPGKVIVNQTLARGFFPNTNPVGRLIGSGWLGDVAHGQEQIIGVVNDTKYRSLREPVRPESYGPLMSLPSYVESFVLYVRTRMPAGAMIVPVQKTLASVDPSLPVGIPETLNEEVHNSISGDRETAVLASLFGIAAALLVCLGIYGLLAYSVAQRTHEIGIRMALGAEAKDVLRMVIGQGLKLALIGVAIGIAGALALTRFLASLLYGVKPTDPLTFIAVSLILIAVALLACYIPARRAAKVDPMVALRYE